MTVTPVTDRMADFAAQAQLTEMPDRVTRRARDLVRICVGAGARAAATSEALALHELLAGLDETPPPPEAAGPLLGPLGPLSHSTAVTFNAACMALGNAGQDGSSSGPGPGNAVVSCVFAAGELGGLPAGRSWRAWSSAPRQASGSPGRCSRDPAQDGQRSA